MKTQSIPNSKKVLFKYNSKPLIYTIIVYISLSFLFSFLPLIVNLENFNHDFLETDKFRVILYFFAVIMLGYPILKVLNKRVWKGYGFTFELRRIFLYCHIFLSPVIIMLGAWHSVVELKIVINFNLSYRLVEISGLLFIISLEILLISGLLPFIAFKFYKKAKINYIHIFGSLLFIISFILHLFV